MNRLDRAGMAMLPSYMAPRWDHETRAILDVLGDRYAPGGDYRELQPLDDAAFDTLRDDLASLAPSLVQSAEYLATSLAAAGCGVLMPDLGLAALDPQTRARLVFALSLCLGRPTAGDHKRRQIIWDVAPRAVEAGGLPTFSTHDREAGFHTDSQYYPMPERYFILYVMTAARCGGGISRLCDGRALQASLDVTETRWMLDLLRGRPLPFRVPGVFRTTDDPGIAQASVAPIFSAEPAIRYRRDTLLDGLSVFQQYCDDDVLRAVSALDREIEHTRHVVEFAMPGDTLLLVDNHQALHARTAFRDARRHLLRIRMRGTEGARPCPFPMISSRIEGAAAAARPRR